MSGRFSIDLLARLALPRLLAGLALILGAATASSCFTEQLTPPNFRFSCDAESDCSGAESCIGGLCQVPCSIVSPELAACEGPAECVNGVCVDRCNTEEANCPGHLMCADLRRLGIDVGDAPLGICVATCTQDSCPEAEVCTPIGFCAVACTQDSCPETEVCTPIGVCGVPCDGSSPNECDDGFACSAGFCLPALSDDGDGQ